MSTKTKGTKIKSEKAVNPRDRWLKLLCGLEKRPKDTCGHGVQVHLNLRKDLTSLLHSAATVEANPESLGCCLLCAVHYMNAFNIVLAEVKENPQLYSDKQEDREGSI